MIWKKSVFNYATWFIYTIIVGIGLVVALAGVCTELGYSALVGFGISGALFIIGVALLWVWDWKFSEGPFVKKIHIDKSHEWKIEAGLVAILLLLGLIIRAVMLKNAPSESVYFEYAKVTANTKLPMKVHGIEHFYIKLLNAWFYMVGNKIKSACWLQILLQLGGFFAGYFAVKKLTGRIAAMVMLAAGMLLPTVVAETYTLSPRMLYFFLYMIVLLLLGIWLKSHRERKKIRVIAGVLIGLMTYLDILGLSLLLVVIAGAFLIQKQDAEKYEVRFEYLLFGIGGCLASALAGMVVDSFVTQTETGHIIGSYIRLYTPRMNGFEVLYTLMDEGVGLAVLLAVMSFGIFSFWCNRKTDESSVWVLVSLFEAVILFLGMTPNAMGGLIWLYLYMMILAGVGIQNFTCFISLEFGKEERVFEKSWPLGEEKEIQGEPGKVVTVEVGGEKREVKLLDNPLPLPKKRVRKAMDYDYEVPEDDDYDIK